MRNRLRENIRCGVIVQKYHTSAFSRCKILIHLLWRDDHRGPRGAGLADPKPRWFQYDMEIFRVANQTLAVFTLWTLTVYLAQKKKAYVLTLVPALFMTVVCVSFLMVSDIAFALPPAVGYAIGGGVGLATALWFMVWLRKMRAGARE